MSISQLNDAFDNAFHAYHARRISFDELCVQLANIHRALKQEVRAA